MTRSFFFALSLSVVLSGCRDKSVAVVSTHKGDLKSDTASTVQKWQPADDGVKLSMGDGLKTGPGSEAIVKLTRGGKLKLPADTTIRFLSSAPGAANPKLAVETGEADIEAEGSEVVIETSIGTAHIEAGSALRVTGSRVEVSVGAARLETEDGGVNLSVGKAFDLALGGAIVERDPPDAGTKAEAPPAVVDAGPPVSGTMVEVHDKGVRRQAKGAKTWETRPEGSAPVSAGDTIDLPGAAAIDVRRGMQHAHASGGKIVIGEDGGAIARATSGKVELDATSEEVRIEVPGGVVVAKVGSRHVEAEVSATTTKIVVRQGESEVRGTTTETVRVGESAVLTPKGAVTLSGRGPERADLSLHAGDSIVVRDPRPPTALGFDFSSACPGAGVVTRDGTVNVRGEKKANMAIPPGAHPYAIHCIGADGVDSASAATGTVTVIADSAKAEIARVPPSSVVDADGRKYTILYQNLLPSVVVRWTDAPAGKGYALTVDGKKTSSDTARVTLKTGSVSEGTHTLKFATADGSKSSADTTIVVKFDNAAPAASITEPADGSFQAGDTVKVAGLVAEGWSVTVGGQATPLDEQRRFSTTATPTVGENAIVIRLSHPQRGVVYYVRHAGAKP